VPNLNYFLPPLFSVEEAKAPDNPNTDCLQKKKEQMGIFQTLDRLEEVVDVLLNTQSSVSSSTLQKLVKAKNTKKSINCSFCSKSFNLGHLKYHKRVHTSEKTPFLSPLYKVLFPVI
jgi:transcription elongation factor Elf1